MTYLPCCHYLSVFSPCYDLINLPTYSSMTCVPSWRSVVTSLLDILIRLPGITHSCFIHVSICDLTYLHNYQSTTRVPPIVFFTFSGMQGRHFFVKLFLFISWMQNRTYLHSPPTMKQHKTLVGHWAICFKTCLAYLIAPTNHFSGQKPSWVGATNPYLK